MQKGKRETRSSIPLSLPPLRSPSYSFSSLSPQSCSSLLLSFSQSPSSPLSLSLSFLPSPSDSLSSSHHTQSPLLPSPSFALSPSVSLSSSPPSVSISTLPSVPLLSPLHRSRSTLLVSLSSLLLQSPSLLPFPISNLPRLPPLPSIFPLLPSGPPVRKFHWMATSSCLSNRSQMYPSLA